MTSPYAPPRVSSSYPSASSSFHIWDTYATTCPLHPNSVQSAGQDSSWALGKHDESLQQEENLFPGKNLYSLKEDTIRRALLSNLAMRYSLTMWSAIVLWQSVPGFEWLVANIARMVEIQVDFCVSFDLGSVWHLLFTHLAHIHTRTPLLCATPLYHRLQNHVEV